ncbi:hypothetical protein HNQ88_003741 [Aureibacter tunicatorum]|uniref:Uncharacterized protein n=1 Tax=Aureibacter tunicatorum TaxID=866807 RepID=A0AAE3XQB3_9BACT|nr:hypothetical protein [Aureibacter tunicatorum]BDD07002.1 hypothetical protein AUTU_44850 [Aureibacter tunicatorum]
MDIHKVYLDRKRVNQEKKHLNQEKNMHKLSF